MPASYFFVYGLSARVHISCLPNRTRRTKKPTNKYANQPTLWNFVSYHTYCNPQRQGWLTCRCLWTFMKPKELADHKTGPARNKSGSLSMEERGFPFNEKVRPSPLQDGRKCSVRSCQNYRPLPASDRYNKYTPNAHKPADN